MKAARKEVEIATVVSDDDNIHLSLMTELYRLGDFINAHYALELERPVISVITKGKQKMTGWFCHDIWTANGKSMHEINICAEALAKGFDEALEILTHEYAHFKNFVVAGNKVVDCTDQQRHNKIFADRAESLGLKVTSSARFGSAHTTLRPEWTKLVYDKFAPNIELFALYRKRFNSSKDKKDKGPQKLKPVIVSVETKTLIEQKAKELGVSQKDFAGAAVVLLATMPDRIKDCAGALIAMLQDTSIAPGRKSIEEVLNEFFSPKIEKTEDAAAK